VILASGGSLYFDLPVTDSTPSLPSSTPHSGTKFGFEFLTDAEMQRRERENLVAVLESARWKLKGPDGAAELLGVKPTTLFSRLKKMGIRRPNVDDVAGETD